MKKQILVFLPFILFVMLGFFLWRGLSLNPTKIPSTLLDKPAPALALPSLFARHPQVTNAFFTGKVTLVNVWASWCVACRAEHEVLLQLQQLPGLQLLGWDYKDQNNDARNFLAENGNPYIDVVWDAQGKVAVNWGVYGTPETFIVDKQGVIRYKHVGPLSEEGVQATIAGIVARLTSE